MCEALSVFSKAFIDWSPDVDRRRLSTLEQDYAQLQNVRRRSISPPQPSEEAEASIVLSEADDLIQERFGIDGIVARSMLCSQALLSGEGIVPLARALVTRLKAGRDREASA